MTYLLDADWIISYLNGRPQAVELIERLSAEAAELEFASDLPVGSFDSHADWIYCALDDQPTFRRSVSP